MSTGIDTPVRRTPQRAALGVLRTMRPRQWVKNVLVGAAPLPAGLLFEVPACIWTTVLAFVSFCLAASSVYLLNDTLDVEADRAHPTKRNRPIAAGVVPVPGRGRDRRRARAGLARRRGAGLAGSWCCSWRVYLAVQVAYCVRLKHEPVLDIAIVASGFLLRAIAGGVASDIALSQWFLLVTAFGSLFMVSGKRYSEMRLAEAAGGTTRASLLRYTASYLRFVWGLSAERHGHGVRAVGLRDPRRRRRTLGAARPGRRSPSCRSCWRCCATPSTSTAAAPAPRRTSRCDDRVLQVVALAWVATFALGVYPDPRPPRP